MPYREFFKNLSENNIPESSILDISGGGKILILSDTHMGSGSRDDLEHNGEMLACILKEYYFKNGWILILNGDIEELQKFSLDDILKKWKCLYEVFDLFFSEKRLYKLLGNHDELLSSKRYSEYPYRLSSVIKINTGTINAFVYHGHQLAKLYANYNKVLGFLIRYLLKPFGIKNITDSKIPHRRFKIEKKAYSFSIKNHCLSIIGHTHRPLFESLSRFDYIKFEIERLCRMYPASQGDQRENIENEVTALRKELGKLKRKEKQDVLRQSLYGDELPVPCLFNSGCTLGKKGINAIELSKDDISLVYWFKEGKSHKFVTRGSYKIDELPGSPYRRTVLNHDKIDYISSKIKLLGS